MKHIFEHAGTVKVPCSNGQDLLWRDDLGIGFLPSNGMEYGEAYWENYQKYASSPNANAINDARIALVCRYVTLTSDQLCDVGIGNGQFALTMGCKGFDVNEHAAAWLKQRNMFGDPYTQQFEALSFWDVLEHIEDPSALLTVPHIFTSLPIHQDLNGLMNSKHLRPNEHLWHFTQEGFIHFMDHFGYNVQEVNDSESKAGRESIQSFYFKRR